VGEEQNECGKHRDSRHCFEAEVLQTQASSLWLTIENMSKEMENGNGIPVVEVPVDFASEGDFQCSLISNAWTTLGRL